MDHKQGPIDFAITRSKIGMPDRLAQPIDDMRIPLHRAHAREHWTRLRERLPSVAITASPEVLASFVVLSPTL
jgi:hypothetical protein